MTKPSKEEAERAIKTLLEYIGEDTNREGLKDTPARVIRSYKELYNGYEADLNKILSKKFHNISVYNDLILLKDINFSSTCEHHMLPFSGSVDIAYIPDKVVIGISKIARLVDAFTKRLQIQERMTAEIAESLYTHLKPLGVAVRVAAGHSCMAVRGTKKEGSILVSRHFTGIFKNDVALQTQFLQLIKT